MTNGFQKGQVESHVEYQPGCEDAANEKQQHGDSQHESKTATTDDSTAAET